MTDTPDKPFIIRQATRSDVLHLVEFLEPFVAQGKLLRRTADELDVLLSQCFLAVAGEKIVGCAALEVYSKKLAEVRSLAVDAGYQGLGIGKQLVQACVERAREQRILEVMAITSAEEFFRSCGFDFTLPGEKKALFLQTRDL